MLIKRSINLRDRWSGHMAFPGGRNEVDEDDRVAAERECMEEIGLRLDDGYVASLAAPSKPTGYLKMLY